MPPVPLPVAEEGHHHKHHFTHYVKHVEVQLDPAQVHIDWPFIKRSALGRELSGSRLM